MKKIYESAEIFCVAFVAVVVTVLFFFRVIVVDGNSMQNTLHPGEKVVVYSIFYTPKRGDIVVTDSNNSYGKPLIKRVIAVGGDRIRIDYYTGDVYLNGELLQEDYIKERIMPSGEAALDIVIPEGYVFLMGDNRNNSYDSRHRDIGPISTNNILGKAFFRLSPFSDIGKIE